LSTTLGQFSLEAQELIINNPKVIMDRITNILEQVIIEIDSRTTNAMILSLAIFNIEPNGKFEGIGNHK
jgi:hypothetical protein